MAAAAVALSAQGGAGAETRGGPFALSGPFGLGGEPLNNVGGSPVGLKVRFIERGRFFVQMLLTNESPDTVTVTDARTLQPARSLLRQVGTRLWPYVRCDEERLPCSLSPSDRYEARLTPVTLLAGGEAGVQLRYQVGTCRATKRGSFAGANAIEVIYEDRQGAARRQTLPIGHGKLFLQRPAGVECVPRPYSHIGLEGSFTTTPGHRPVLGSDGDTCVKSVAGALTYRSRLFTDRDGIRWRVKIWFPRFKGTGVYGTLRSPGPAGPADVIVTGGFGDPGKSTFHGRPSKVTVTQATGPLFGGRLEATLAGRRRFFRAYGAWRCTTDFPR